jgi:ectoine hydrolase
VIEQQGIVKDSRIGYSVGLGYPPDWGERALSLGPGDKTELQPNMTHLRQQIGFAGSDVG